MATRIGFLARCAAWEDVDFSRFGELTATTAEAITAVPGT